MLVVVVAAAGVAWTKRLKDFAKSAAVMFATVMITAVMTAAVMIAAVMIAALAADIVPSSSSCLPGRRMKDSDSPYIEVR